MKKNPYTFHAINMNWEQIEQEFKLWVSEKPDKRMVAYRTFIDWLKQNYKHLNTERDEQKNVSSITKT